MIELLVVISIIAILMGLAFPAFQGVQNAAKKTQAKNDEVQIVTAANAFYTEYGRYPVPNSANAYTADTLFGDSNNSGGNKSYQVMNVLAYLLNINNKAVPNKDDVLKQNPRGVAFFQGRAARDSQKPSSGYDGDGNFFDPWGRTYAVALDLSYDNVTQTYTPQYTDLIYANEPQSGTPGIQGGAIAFSFGYDGEQGKKGNKKFSGSDDVISWQ